MLCDSVFVVGKRRRLWGYWTLETCGRRGISGYGLIEPIIFGKLICPNASFFSFGTS